MRRVLRFFAILTVGAALALLAEQGFRLYRGDDVMRPFLVLHNLKVLRMDGPWEWRGKQGTPLSRITADPEFFLKTEGDREQIAQADLDVQGMGVRPYHGMVFRRLPSRTHQPALRAGLLFVALPVARPTGAAAFLMYEGMMFRKPWVAGMDLLFVEDILDGGDEVINEDGWEYCP